MHRPSGSTPNLSSFLRTPSQGKILRANELTSFIREAWAAGRFEGMTDLDQDTRPYRIIACYRIARAMANALGHCSEDETLEAAIDQLGQNPWTQPLRPGSADWNATDSTMPSWGAKRIWKQAIETPLTLLPGDTAESQEAWTAAALDIGEALGMPAYDAGVLGLQPLVRPGGAALCDVTGTDLLAFEDILLIDIMELFLDKGERLTVTHLREEYGIRRKEAVMLLRVAKVQSQRETVGSVEEKRAVHERRLENFLARSKETMDMDGEMKALKELAKIQGLTRVAPEDAAADFLDVVRRVSNRQDIEKLDTETRLLIQGKASEEPRRVVLEPEDDDMYDDEALEEFDQEN